MFQEVPSGCIAIFVGDGVFMDVKILMVQADILLYMEVNALGIYRLYIRFQKAFGLIPNLCSKLNKLLKADKNRQHVNIHH